MPFYRDQIYPRLVDALGDPPPIRAIRRQIIPSAEGIVLEIGAGSGANLPYYDPARVRKLYALEPNPGMVRLARRRLERARLRVEFLDLPGEHIPLEAGSVDNVVSTFTLCTIAAVRDAIQALQRVLRPGGRLLFFELGLAPDPAVQRWQRRLEPLARRLFAGLYLTRDIPALLVAGGFELERIEAGYLARFPRSASYGWWGSAQARRS